MDNLWKLIRSLLPCLSLLLTACSNTGVSQDMVPTRPPIQPTTCPTPAELSEGGQQAVQSAPVTSASPVTSSNIVTDQTAFDESTLATREAMLNEINQAPALLITGSITADAVPAPGTESQVVTIAPGDTQMPCP